MDTETSESYQESTVPPKRVQLFKQQKLPALISKFSLKCIYPILLTCFIFFTTFGFVMLYTSSRYEFQVDYTDCISDDLSIGDTCENYLKTAAFDTLSPLCTCKVLLEIRKLIPSQVYMYYKLINFQQNIRTFAASVDFDQLRGEQKSLSPDCQPYRTTQQDSKTLNIAPCGALANSMFNDSFSFDMVDTDGKTVVSNVPLINTGIAYSYDKKVRFKNPPDWTDTVKPPFWRKTVMELDLNNTGNNGYENEDLMVWLRPGAFESPKKLHRLIDHESGPFTAGLSPGSYNLTVHYNFPVSSFGGRKMIILSSTNWMGTTSLFLPIIYLIVGVISLTTTIAIFSFPRIKRRF